MQTVILAAGEGTRMRPLTESVPKPMLPVAGKPLLGHTVDGAMEAGASRIVIVVGYKSETVEAYFEEERAGVPIDFVNQESQRGTADAVRAARDALDPEPFVVLNGDVLYDQPSLNTLYTDFPAVGSYRVDDPSNYGVLVLSESGERVRGVIEKPADPPSQVINTGSYAFPEAALEYLDVGESERGELELTDVLERTCESFDVANVPFDRWLDVGRPWELLEANEWQLEGVASRIDGTVHEDAVLDGRVVVEDEARIRSGVVIEGPAVIGNGAEVGPNAYVRGATYLGEDVKVGHSVEVKNSVLLAGTSVGHLSYVGDSILGEDVNFGAGTTIANLRHDDEAVSMMVKGERVSTGRRKFGAVCGPRAKTGINTSLNAGVKLPAGGRTKPGETVLRDP